MLCFIINVLCKNNRENKKKIMCSLQLCHGLLVSKSDTFGATQDLLPLDQAQNVDWS